MHQAVTKVNVFGPVIFIVTKVDASHCSGRQHNFSRQRQERDNFVGVLSDGMVQDGLFVNLGYLHSSAREGRRYVGTSLKGRGLTKDDAEVGSGGSTWSEIRTRTWGSTRQLDGNFNTGTRNPPRLTE